MVSLLSTVRPVKTGRTRLVQSMLYVALTCWDFDQFAPLASLQLLPRMAPQFFPLRMLFPASRCTSYPSSRQPPYIDIQMPSGFGAVIRT